MSAAVLTPTQTCATDAVYRALDPAQREIRVLHVSGSPNKNETLDCTLQIVSLYSDPKPEYEAISYCWGELQGRDQKRLNGSVVGAPASAMNVLRRFRRTEGSRTLWIDAICINQDDLEERAQQVSIMKHVYRSTSSCLIWLGEASPKSGDVIRYIENVSRTLHDQLFCASDWTRTTKLDSDFTYENLSLLALFGDGLTAREMFSLFEKPWFSRVWVMQEAVLSPKATCRWGDWTVSWQDVYRTARWSIQEYRRGPDSILGITDLTSWFSGLFLATVAWRYAVHDKHLQHEDVPFYSTMETCTHLKVSDDRDRLYGILGLFTYPPERSTYLDWLRVDYTRSVLEVFRDATRAAIVQELSLRILQQVDRVSARQNDLGLHSFYSWAFPLHQARTPRPRRLMELDCLCADRPMKLELLVPHQNEDKLLLNGYGVSRVSTIMTHATFGVQDPGGHLGNMINQAIQHLTATNCGHLIHPMILAMAARSDINVPEISTEAGWIDFANVFTEFCWDHQTKSESYKALASEFKEFLKPLFNSAIHACAGRRLFLTSDGRIGLGHENLNENDEVTAIFGSIYLLILRPTINVSSIHETPEARTEHVTEVNCHRFVGFAYVPRIMDGEAVDAFEEARIEPQTFCLW